MRTLERKSFLSILLVMSLMLVGCASDSKKKSGSDASSVMDDAGANQALELQGSSDDNTAGPLQTVYFDFNQSRLTSAAKSALENNAMWLKGAASVDIQVEGHCDERGGQQYNLALGERRAKAVKGYLEGLGVQSSRVSVITYGKEKPVSFGHDEESWSKNRRANFVITAK